MLQFGIGSTRRCGGAVVGVALRRALLLAGALGAFATALPVQSALAQGAPGSLSELGCWETQQTQGAPECGPSHQTPGLSGAQDVAVSPDGKNVYVVSSGGNSSSGDNSIAEFTRNNDGSLTPLADPNNCIAEAGANSSCSSSTAQGLYDPQAIVISPDGKNVYVAGTDAPPPDGQGVGGNGAIAVFDRNPDGSLTQRASDDCVAETESQTGNSSTCGDQSAHGIFFPFALAVSPDGQNVYAADADGEAVAAFQRNGNGSLSQPGGRSDCIADRNAESSDCSNSAFGIGGATSVIVSPDGTSVYSAGSTSGQQQGGAISTFERGAGGSLSQPGGANDCIQTQGSDEGCSNTGVGFAGFTIGLAASPDGRNVYSASEQPAGPIAEFARAPNGSLSQLPAPNSCIQEGGGSGCATGTGIGSGYELKVSPDGASVYTAAESNGCASNSGCSDVAEFSRNAADGSLAQLSPPDDCIQDATAAQIAAQNEARPECGNETGTGLGGPGLAISPDNANVYVTGNNDIAEFSRTPIQYTLTVTRSGSGSGSVTDDKGGIVCPPDATCSHPYNEGTMVTLTAHPASGSTFAGWSGGGCSGTGSCTVTMNSDTTVTATFAVASPPLPPAGAPGSPSIKSNQPTPLGGNTAGYSGSVNPENSSTFVFWQYGLDKRYRKAGAHGPRYTNATARQRVGSDGSDHSVSTSVHGLLPNALYHVRMVAFNSNGTAYGRDQTFITLSGPRPGFPPSASRSTSPRFPGRCSS